MTQKEKHHNLLKTYSQPIYLVKEDHTNDRTRAYAELTLDSTTKLIEKIKKIQNVKDFMVFNDIGSGNGKILMHWLTMTDSKKAVGIERNQQRCRIAKDLLKEMQGFDDKKCQVINKDLMKYNKFGDIVFFNDLFFTAKETLHVWDNLEPDSLFITYSKLKESYPIDSLPLEQNLKIENISVNFYRKPFVKTGLVSRLGLGK